eukprot:s436_g25.t1
MKKCRDLGFLVCYVALVQCSTVQVTQRPAEATNPNPFEAVSHTRLRDKSASVHSAQGEQCTRQRTGQRGPSLPSLPSPWLFLLSRPSLARSTAGAAGAAGVAFLESGAHARSQRMRQI